MIFKVLTENEYKLIYKLLFLYVFNFSGDWGLGIGDWGLGVGDWAQSPNPNPQSPIPNKQMYCHKSLNKKKKNI